MARKAAVVIGVNKTGSLATLTSASSGAESVASWLEGEGYDVACLTDKEAPVRARDVEDAIAGFVTLPPRYKLLVVYFSGHGYWHARADCWLLSEAPVRANEAINLNGAMDLARYSGITNVVFISDACRSIPNSRSGAYVTGVDGFPNYAEISTSSKIDFFKATSEAHAAYEGKIDGRRQSILTHALISAYREPEPDMIRQVSEGDQQLQVVPNRKLESYLQKKINEILATIDINLTQNIEANVPSSEDIYIATVDTPEMMTSQPGVNAPSGSSEDTTQPEFCAPADPLEDHYESMPAEEVAEMTTTSRIDEIASALEGRVSRDILDSYTFLIKNDSKSILKTLPRTAGRRKSNFETHLPGQLAIEKSVETGFVVHGAKVIKAVASSGKSGATVEILKKGNGNNKDGLIELSLMDPAVSVAIQLEDGRCLVLAGLDGYIGHAVVDQDGLANVSYIPSEKKVHQQWMYEEKKTEVDTLRAMVAIQIKNNSFKIQSDSEATVLGDKIRMQKAIDPTLGLYAAHAFSQAGNDKKIQSVKRYMRYDLGVDLFDVMALTSRFPETHNQHNGVEVVPFCPLLTQTWNLLRPRNIILPKLLQNLTPYLCNSLWTTFQPKAAESLLTAIDKGDLQ